MKTKILLIGLALLICFPHFSMAKEFPYKKISFVIGYSPGGGYDVIARAMAPYFSKYLPTNPAVIIVNKPGGGGRLAAQHMMKAEPDGHTIALWNAFGMAILQKSSKVNYDLKKITWLGRANTEVPALAVAKGGRYQSWEDLKKASEIRMGITGIATNSGITTILLFHSAMKKKLILVPHDSSAEAITAAIRGDVDGISNSYSTLQPGVEAGDLIPIMQFSDVPYPDIPKSVPTVADLGFPELAEIQTQRLIGGPPGMDKKTTKIISDALLKAQSDPELVAWAKKTQRPLDPLPPEKVQQMVVNLLDVLEKYSGDIQDFMKLEKK
jgi:tripartite-type tricarboxylate transporter receptor subunit TctC